MKQLFNRKLGALFAALWLGFAPHVALAASLINPYSFASAGPTSYVNSVQHGTITIAAGATSGTATISAVGSKAFMVWNGYTAPASATGARIATRLALTDSTTVTATRNTLDAGNAITVPFSVVDATDALVDSVQRGTISITGGTSGTATVTSVDTARSVVNWLGASTTSTNTNPRPAYGSSVLTNATTVTSTFSVSSDFVASYEVVQFNAAAIQSIQNVADAYTTTNTTDTKTISSVTEANTILLFGGINSTNINAWNVFYTRKTTSSTNVDLTRGDTNATSRTPVYSAITFANGVLKSRQQAEVSLTGVTSNTASITSVNTAKTALFYGGSRNASTTAGAHVHLMAASLTGPTAVTGTAGATDGSSAAAVAATAAEFN